MSDESQNQSDSTADQWLGMQRREGSQINADDEYRSGTSLERDGGQRSGAGDHEDAGPMTKISRKIAWSMRFLP